MVFPLIFMLSGNIEICKNLSVAFWQGLEWKFLQKEVG
jgi:hypothetical protein